MGSGAEQVYSRNRQLVLVLASAPTAAWHARAHVHPRAACKPSHECWWVNAGVSTSFPLSMLCIKLRFVLQRKGRVSGVDETVNVMLEVSPQPSALSPRPSALGPQPNCEPQTSEGEAAPYAPGRRRLLSAWSAR